MSPAPNPLPPSVQGNAYSIMPAQAFPFDNTTGSNKPVNGPCIIMGACIRNKGGAASNPFRILDGNDVNGSPIYTAQLGASQDLNPTFGTNGVIARTGIFTVDNGSQADGVVWVVPL